MHFWPYWLLWACCGDYYAALHNTLLGYLRFGKGRCNCLLGSGVIAGGMPRFISALTVLVPDYDAAISFYVDQLGFILIEDTVLSADKRWVLVAPSPVSETRLLLAKAASDPQQATVGNQAGGRVFLFLNTDQFDADYAAYRQAGVHFVEAPRTQSYGKVAVFADPFGNRWDLIETAAN